MRAALYVRVSTERQTHATQERELREEAKRRGWKVVQVYAETVSGAAVKRPQLSRLRHDAALKRFRVVLIWSIDRLGRSVLEMLTIAEELKRHGVGLASFREPAVDTTGPTGRMVLQIWAAFAEFERAQIIARTRAGLATARLKGRVGGRKRKVSAETIHQAVRENLGNKTAAARQLKISVRTVHRAGDRDTNVAPKSPKPAA